MGALGIQSAPSGAVVDALNIEVWPNPVLDWIQVGADGPIVSCLWSVLDLTGRDVASGKGAMPFQIDASGWPSGAFFLRVKVDGGQVQTFRMVKG